MSKLAVANIIFETTESNRIEYTGNNVVRVRANGGVQLPFGTTAQRASPEYGLLRYNTDTGTVEMYDAGGWFNMPTGGYVNVIYTTANAAYALANNVAPQIAPSYNNANAAFRHANAAYDSANNVAPQVTPAFNTANLAFLTANAAFGVANNALANTQDVNIQRYLQVGDFAYNGNGSRLGGNSLLFNYFGGSTIDTAGDIWFRDTSYNTLVTLQKASGNVGIGTISPGYKLDVIGTINAANILINGASIAANLAPAFNQANVAYNTANLAYGQANAAYTAANTKFSSSGGSITGAVEINGSLTVHGNTTFVDQTTLSVGDPLIYLAANNYSSDVVDIGFVANYVNATSSNVHTGLFRSSGTKEYYLFQGYDKEPYNNYIDPTGNNITMAVLNSTVRTSNLILGGANAINWISAAYGQSNTNATTITSAYNTANAVYNQSNIVFGVANAAFAKANSGMQNTTFTLNGSLTIANTNSIAVPIWYENESNITASYTLTAGRNAMTAGPVTLNTGVTITVPVGSTWTVV